jgi:hypothetical protein
MIAFGRIIQGIIFLLCLHIWIRTGLKGGNMCGHISWREKNVLDRNIYEYERMDDGH